jgi:predicted flap endonuclease-1-like 5' DNA nuclease
MSVTISDIKGLQPELKTKLESEGIRNTTQLLEHTQTQKQRSELAHKVGATPVAIKELANRADLMRLNGVGGYFSHLLEDAGVNSCRELQHRVPEKLHKTLEAMSTDKKIGHRAPTLVQTTEWITEAKKLAATSPE